MVSIDYQSAMITDVAPTIDTLGSRIRYAREQKGLTQLDIARFFDIQRVSVTQWESDTTKPALSRIQQLAELLGTTSAWLLEGKGEPPAARQGSGAQKHFSGRSVPTPSARAHAIPAAPLVGERNLPVYVAARGGDGHIIVNFEAIDHVKRPADLENVRDAYAILIAGDSMVPAYEPGDMALVHPHLTPAREKDFIFYHVPPNGGEAEAIVKRLVALNDREWTLRQYNPAQEFKVSRADWPICHRVVGKYNAR